VIQLGGEAKSAELRDWALHELNGYGPDDELPPYRTFTAPLQIDWMNRARWVRGETISSLELPDFARDVITDQVNLRYGIAQIEELARRCKPGDVVKLAPPGAQELVTLMNAKRQDAQIERLYWGVSPVVLWGVVDRVRTTLTAMTAEIRAEMFDSGGVISPAVADNALSVAVTGKRNKVTVTAPQGDQIASTADEPRKWWRTAGAVIAGVVGLLVAMAGGLFALMQAQGWRF
jgi:AbiTii